MKTRTSEYCTWITGPLDFPPSPGSALRFPVFKASTDLENEGCHRKDLKAERAKSIVASLIFRIRNERQAFTLLRDRVWSIVCAFNIFVLLNCVASFFVSFLILRLWR